MQIIPIVDYTWPNVIINRRIDVHAELSPLKYSGDCLHIEVTLGVSNHIYRGG